jgi:hypothetical protein
VQPRVGPQRAPRAVALAVPGARHESREGAGPRRSAGRSQGSRRHGPWHGA